MHMLRRSVFALIMSVFVVSCTDQPTGPVMDSPQFSVSAPVGMRGASAEPGEGVVTVPFSARFYTDIAGFVQDDCGPGIGLNTQQGEGKATHLGKFTTTMTFCFNTNPPPAFGEYYGIPGPENGRFVAANGDELWFTIPSGRVVPFVVPDPVYWAFFKDPFVFTGGTGRFVGATGGGHTNSLVEIARVRTDHEWTGTLTLRPSN